MEQLQCKICGQALVEVRQGFYKCSGCLSEFEKKATVTDEQRKLQEAYELIRKGDFSDAESLCTTLLSTHASSYEAYWVRALAKNGVIFVRDVGDKMVPTCQNIVEKSFLSHADVVDAIRLAPREIAENYRTQGARIEAIRKEWFDIASKEPPCDVFICFKDSDKEHGIIRTEDSIFAQDMYNYLCTKGLNVFFSRISLMGKVSEHYEPYIYNAIKTAKVMIVYGEKAEYFNSTWLRNEWSRFIARMQHENMPQESLIVAYRGVDPYRIPTALLGGRQGLDMTPPSAFNILVDKVIATVSNAQKVVTLERKEIKGGQMATKASAIVQTEIQKRTIGAKAPAKLDFSLESKLRMVKSYLAQEMWQEAEEMLALVLEKAPQNGDALICKLLLKTKNKTLNDFNNLAHFTDIKLLQDILDSADLQTAQQLLDQFYAMQNLPEHEYNEILAIILPYEYSNRAHNIEKSFESVIAKANISGFKLLLQTLNSNEVDRYIILNRKMAINLTKEQDRKQARAYLHNILSVNPGDLEALCMLCEMILLEKQKEEQIFITQFEVLLQYADNTNKYVKHFIDMLVADSSIKNDEINIIRALLSYYQGDIIQLKETLLNVAHLAVSNQMFDQAEYFTSLILQSDAQCTFAWLYLCLADARATSITDIINSKIPIEHCRGFTEYCALVDDVRQTELITMQKKQREAIAKAETLRRKKHRNAGLKLLSTTIGVVFFIGLTAFLLISCKFGYSFYQRFIWESVLELPTTTLFGIQIDMCVYVMSTIIPICVAPLILNLIGHWNKFSKIFPISITVFFFFEIIVLFLIGYAALDFSSVSEILTNSELSGPGLSILTFLINIISFIIVLPLYGIFYSVIMIFRLLFATIICIPIIALLFTPLAVIAHINHKLRIPDCHSDTQ